MPQLVPARASRVSHRIDQAAHGFSVGQAITLSGGTYALAQADDADTLAVGLVSRIETNSFEYVSQGDMAWTAHGLTVETDYYLSLTTAGELTTSKPTGSTEYQQLLVYPLDANTVRVNEYKPWLVSDLGGGFRVQSSTADFPSGTWVRVGTLLAYRVAELNIRTTRSSTGAGSISCAVGLAYDSAPTFSVLSQGGAPRIDGCRFVSDGGGAFVEFRMEGGHPNGNIIQDAVVVGESSLNSFQFQQPDFIASPGGTVLATYIFSQDALLYAGRSGDKALEIKAAGPLQLCNGDGASGGNSSAQIQLGYQQTDEYPSYIATRHSDGDLNSEVRVNVNQGAVGEAFNPTAANLRIIGSGQAHLSDASGDYVAPTSDTHIATKKFVDDKTGGGSEPDPDSGYAVLNGLSITAGEQYTISILSQNQANYWSVGLRYASGVDGVQALDITSSFRTASGSANANFQVMANGINGTKIADLLRIHYTSSSYRISFRAAVTTTINIGSYGRNMTSARNQRANGLGTAVSTGTSYGTVAL